MIQGWFLVWCSGVGERARDRRVLWVSAVAGQHSLPGFRFRSVWIHHHAHEDSCDWKVRCFPGRDGVAGCPHHRCRFLWLKDLSGWGVSDSSRRQGFPHGCSWHQGSPPPGRGGFVVSRAADRGVNQRWGSYGVDENHPHRHRDQYRDPCWCGYWCLPDHYRPHRYLFQCDRNRYPHQRRCLYPCVRRSGCCRGECGHLRLRWGCWRPGLGRGGG